MYVQLADVYGSVLFVYSIECYTDLLFHFIFSIFFYLSSSSFGLFCVGRSYKNCKEVFGQLYMQVSEFVTTVSLDYKNHLYAAGPNHSYFLYNLNFHFDMLVCTYGACLASLFSILAVDIPVVVSYQVYDQR